MIKVAVVAPYPAHVVLSDEMLKPRFRTEGKKKKHPAPWVRALCRELSRHEDIQLRVFSHSRSVAHVVQGDKEGVHYTFVPKYESVKSDPYHLYLPALLQMLPLLHRFNPDLVHGFGMESAYGLLAVIQSRARVVFIQGIQEELAPYYSMPKIKLAIHKRLERLVVHRTDGLIAETDFAKRWALSVRKDVPVKVIPHAYSGNFFDVKPCFSGRRVVCVGALSEIKGVATVLAAFHRGVLHHAMAFHETGLVFVGGGPLQRVLEKQAERWGISDKVTFRGHLSHVQVAEEMQASDLMVIASRMDTSPNVITEAHAVGIPVVGTYAGGIPDMIEEGKDGFVVPVDDVSAMAERMADLLQSQEKRMAMGQAGREKVRVLNDPGRVAEKHVKYYREILEARKERSR
jgi:glycosyltransferase involved in cell wall biosynthesis